jgi:LPS-assembly lipoprotein
MYQSDDGRTQLEYSVRINPISGTDGIELRNKLRVQLNPFGEPANPLYVLTVKFLPRQNILKGIQRTGDATWQEIRISVSFDLADAETGKKILSGSDSVSESYTFVQNLVAADSAAASATGSALRILSEKVGARVKVFIQSREAAAE